ncbi:MAG: hypothetical protein AMXMBFR8_12070 [Nevskiales bacterium]
MPELLQFRPQFLKIVDLAVVSDHEAPGAATHRLRAIRREVHNCQSPVAKENAGIRIRPMTVTIRTPMQQTAGHVAKRPVWRGDLRTGIK